VPAGGWGREREAREAFDESGNDGGWATF